MSVKKDLLPAATAWLEQCDTVDSAVLFGSRVQAKNLESWSDVDLHIITSDARTLESVDWSKAMPSESFCLQVVRPATGGVRKITAIFDAGQVDLVIVPLRELSMVADQLHAGTSRTRELDVALNEMATCLHSGYRFLKGQVKWGPFYERVATLVGVRLEDSELKPMAEIFLCDLLWVLQKLRRGEIVAAQHALHGKLVEANLRLWRELQLRRGHRLTSFGLGRRFEELGSVAELDLIRVNAKADKAELQRAAHQCFICLQTIMKELMPGWSAPARLIVLFNGLTSDNFTTER
jgi:hypothetical protein